MRERLSRNESEAELEVFNLWSAFPVEAVNLAECQFLPRSVALFELNFFMNKNNFEKLFTSMDFILFL